MIPWQTNSVDQRKDNIETEFLQKFNE